jgi:hypothetical protein
LVSLNCFYFNNNNNIENKNTGFENANTEKNLGLLSKSSFFSSESEHSFSLALSSSSLSLLQYFFDVQILLKHSNDLHTSKKYKYLHLNYCFIKAEDVTIDNLSDSSDYVNSIIVIPISDFNFLLSKLRTENNLFCIILDQPKENESKAQGIVDYISANDLFRFFVEIEKNLSKLFVSTNFLFFDLKTINKSKCVDFEYLSSPLVFSFNSFFTSPFSHISNFSQIILKENTGSFFFFSFFLFYFFLDLVKVDKDKTNFTQLKPKRNTYDLSKEEYKSVTDNAGILDDDDPETQVFFFLFLHFMLIKYNYIKNMRC